MRKQKENSLSLVLGLGNPGRKYENTRHNVGFLTVDALARTLDIQLKKRFLKPYIVGTSKKGAGSGMYTIIKPLTFMNRSGTILPHILNTSIYTVSDIILICDNMDLPPGEIRIKRKGSSAGHNGIKSVMEYASSGEFTRIYIGVGRPAQGISVVDHVLGIPEGDELESMLFGVASAAQALEAILSGADLSKVINEYNRRKGPDRSGQKESNGSL